MPKTDFTYEEFETMLAILYLTLRPIRDGKKEGDREDFDTLKDILDGFAERHGVRTPEETLETPRCMDPGEELEPAEDCQSLIDLLGSFWHDFGVATTINTVDSTEHVRLGRIILGVLHRYGIIVAGFDTVNGERVPTRIAATHHEKERQPLYQVVAAA